MASSIQLRWRCAVGCPPRFYLIQFLLGALHAHVKKQIWGPQVFHHRHHAAGPKLKLLSIFGYIRTFTAKLGQDILPFQKNWTLLCFLLWTVWHGSQSMLHCEMGDKMWNRCCLSCCCLLPRHHWAVHLDLFCLGLAVALVPYEKHKMRNHVSHNFHKLEALIRIAQC